ncbi:MAG: hypothetical protein A2X22_06180 [Bacteroidetes bacterium GWF2_49_14]|nr:MAG: hypothetical protein A2X22_06180 [Bacteroidetes bacterium GWF2_49_14]
MDLNEELKKQARQLTELQDSVSEIKGLLVHRQANQDEWLCPKEARQILKVSARKEQYLRDSGKLPFTKIGRDVRINRSCVIKLLNEGC